MYGTAPINEKTTRESRPPLTLADKLERMISV